MSATAAAAAHDPSPPKMSPDMSIEEELCKKAGVKKSQAMIDLQRALLKSPVSFHYTLPDVNDEIKAMIEKM